MALLLVCDKLENYAQFLQTKLSLPPEIAWEKAGLFLREVLREILLEFEREHIRDDIEAWEEGFFFADYRRRRTPMDNDQWDRIKRSLKSICVHKDSPLRFVDYRPSGFGDVARELNDRIASAVRQFARPELKEEKQ